MPTITPMGPAASGASQNQSQESPQQSARERAIARLMGNQAPTQAAPTPAPAEVMTAQASSDASTLAAVQGSPDTGGETKPPKSDATDTALSPQYAALARKEKALRSQVQELKARELALKAKEESLNKPTVETADAYRTRINSLTPLQRLKELGLSYDDVTADALNQASPQDQMINELRNEIKALRDSQDQSKKSFEESQTQQYQQAVAQIRNEAKSLINSDPNFETIKETGSLDDVVDLIEQTFKADGVLLSVEEAAQSVEEYLVEEAMKLARLKKIQERLKPAVKEPVAESTPQQGSGATQQANALKTLTNANSASRPMSARERAIAAFKGQLK